MYSLVSSNYLHVEKLLITFMLIFIFGLSIMNMIKEKSLKI